MQQTMTRKPNIEKAFNGTVDKRPAGNSKGFVGLEKLIMKPLLCSMSPFLSGEPIGIPPLWSCREGVIRISRGLVVLFFYGVY